MGLGASKIPQQVPGHLLLLTGVKEFDRVYSYLESSVKNIKELETDLNMITTEFIKILGAREVWEINPNVQKLIQILLVVLSADSNGALSSLIEYSSDFPYLIIHRQKLSKPKRVVCDKFNNLMEILRRIPIESEKYVKKLTSKIDTVCGFQNNIADKTIALGYSMNDKLAAINITVGNFEICDICLRIAEEIKIISGEVMESVSISIQKAQTSPFREILVSQGLQAANEGLIKPKSIVKKFWSFI